MSGSSSVLSLDAHPRIVTGNTTPDVTTPALPSLGHDSITNGFHIVMDGVINYMSASQAVTRALRDRPVTTAGRTIRIVAVNVLPASGGKLALGVSFDGDAKGTLRLVGTPSYDKTLRLVSVPDVDFDLTTDSQILEAYAWLRSDVLRNTLRQNAHWSAAPAI